ncbi:lipoprotein [Mesoplasma florum]|uniref:lipoprotein n=1 Tax=Mesoplasma florum TaxID=2151 RepID=UPI0018F8991B|nr:lipoprotein [Mesoplasma florum]
MKKLLSILGAVGLTATGASVAVSCSNTTDPGDKTVLALGDITIAGKPIREQYKADATNKAQKTNAEVILDAFKAKNKNLTVSGKATVEGITLRGAKIKDGETVYNVTYTGTEEKQSVETVLALGDITIAGKPIREQYKADATNKAQKTNAEVILDAFKAKNKNLTVSGKATVEGITLRGAKIKDGETVYNVTYTGTEEKQSVETVLALGDITIAGKPIREQYKADATNKAQKTNAEVILDAFKAKNKDLTVSAKATVEGITLRGAKIKDGETVYNVTYTGTEETS